MAAPGTRTPAPRQQAVDTWPSCVWYGKAAAPGMKTYIRAAFLNEIHDITE